MILGTKLKMQQFIDSINEQFGGSFTCEMEEATLIKQLIEAKNLFIQIGIEDEEMKGEYDRSVINYRNNWIHSEKASDLLSKEIDEIKKELIKCRESYTELQRKSEEEIKDLKLINDVLVKKARDQIDEIKELKHDLQKAVRSYKRIKKDYDPDLSYDKFQEKILDSYKESKESEEY